MPAGQRLDDRGLGAWHAVREQSEDGGRDALDHGVDLGGAGEGGGLGAQHVCSLSILKKLPLSSTLAIFRIFEQIQWFSGSGLEALSPCFATVFFSKWPKSSLALVRVAPYAAVLSSTDQPSGE